MSFEAREPGVMLQPTTLPSVTTKIRILHVEDDAFQRQVLKHVLSSIESDTEGISVTVTSVETAQEALEATRERGAEFDLVLLDMMLPGGDGDTIVSELRQNVGQFAAIIMLSGDRQEANMQRCWLDLGADSYRIKPVSMKTVQDILSYTMDKRRIIQKRRRAGQGSDEEEGDAVQKYSRQRQHDARNKQADELSPENTDGKVSATSHEPVPAIVDLIANGRRGPVHLAFDKERPVALKVHSLMELRGPPPPAHPHVVRTLQRLVTESQCVEIRELCSGGELFNYLLTDVTESLSMDEVSAWLRQLASAVAHCHAHGAVHGQLHPENLLLNEDSTSVSVTGFYCYRDSNPSMVGASIVGSATGSPSDPASPLVDGVQALSATIRVTLRPFNTRLNAPELMGRSHATPKELAACDVYALGQLAVNLMTGRPADEAALEIMMQALVQDCSQHDDDADDGVRGLPAAVRVMSVSGGVSGASVYSPPQSPAASSTDTQRLQRRKTVELAIAALQPESTQRPSATAFLQWLMDPPYNNN